MVFYNLVLIVVLLFIGYSESSPVTSLTSEGNAYNKSNSTTSRSWDKYTEGKLVSSLCVVCYTISNHDNSLFYKSIGLYQTDVISIW